MRMWNVANELLEMFHVLLNEELDVAGPSESSVEKEPTMREKVK
jgi:hypothetical protein